MWKGSIWKEEKVEGYKWENRKRECVYKGKKEALEER